MLNIIYLITVFVDSIDLTSRRYHMVEHTKASCTLSSNGDLVWISSEVGNVFLNPDHGQPLVQHCLIAWSILNTKGEETKWTKSVVDSDNDDIMGHPSVCTIPVSRSFKDLSIHLLTDSAFLPRTNAPPVNQIMTERGLGGGQVPGT